VPVIVSKVPPAVGQSQVDVEEDCGQPEMLVMTGEGVAIGICACRLHTININGKDKIISNARANLARKTS